jgi:hypothetical protein
VHSLIHSDYVKASARKGQPRRGVASHDRPHAPPGRVRVVVAFVLAGVASRVDRESARRAVA